MAVKTVLRFKTTILASVVSVTGANASEQQIKVLNCLESADHIAVIAYDTLSGFFYTMAYIDPGDEGKVHCKFSSCDLDFKTTKQIKYVDDTKHSPWYVYVDDSREILVGDTDSVCNQ